MHHFRHQGGVSGGNHRSQKWEANSESFHPSQCDSLDQSYRRANENGWPSEACQARAHATTRYSSLRSSSLIDDDGGGGGGKNDYWTFDGVSHLLISTNFRRM